MYEDLNVWIGIVKHKTFIEVNEEGTEAAAVTTTGMGMGPQDSGLLSFEADHPFIFMIREHQSQTILFIGKITDPVFE
jgi:serpin B